MKVSWPDLKIPPINLYQMPDVLWFYNPDAYFRLVVMRGFNR